MFIVYPIECRIISPIANEKGIPSVTIAAMRKFISRAIVKNISTSPIRMFETITLSLFSIGLDVSW